MKKLFIDTKLLTFYILSISILILLRDIGGVGIPKTLFIGVCVLSMAIANKENLIYMIVFIIPFLCGLPGTYIMLFALLMFLFKSRRVKRSALFLFVMVCVFEMFALFFLQGNFITTSIQYISYIGTLIFIIYDEEDINYQLCLKLFNVGILIVSLAILVMTFKSAPTNWKYLFSQGWFRIGDIQMEENTGMMLVLNANSMAYFCLVGISCSLLLLEIDENTRKKLIYIIETCLFIAIAIMTNSRTFILMLVIILILFLISKKVSIKSIIAMLFVGFIIGLIGWTVMNNNTYLLKGILSRLNDSTIKSAGGRTELFPLYFERWSCKLRTLLFGAGVAGYREVYKMEDSVHNGLLQVLICYGVFGSIMMAFVFFRPIFVGFNRKVPLKYYLPVISVIFFTQTIQFLNPCFLMLPYIIGVLAIKEGEKRK